MGVRFLYKISVVVIFVFFVCAPSWNMLGAQASWWCLQGNCIYPTKDACDAERNRLLTTDPTIVECFDSNTISPLVPNPTVPSTPPPDTTAPAQPRAIPLNKDYVPLSPIPGVIDGKQTPEVYLNNVFKFGIGIAAVLAVLMLVICGFKYVTTESFGGKGDAKSCIWAAIGGLLIVFTAYLVLNTINPELTKINFAELKIK